MPHSKSLRAVGDSLQSLGVSKFILEKAGQGYIVRTEQPLDPAQLLKPNLSGTAWERLHPSSRHAKLFRQDGALHYDASYVSWLDAQGKRKRRERFTAQASGTKTLAQLMRTLGRHLDRVEPHDFHFSWGDEAVDLDYRLPDGRPVQEVLTVVKLRELTLRSRFRRAPRR